jgi:hypothetical protein
MAVCSPPPGELLAQHLPGLALHLERGHRFAGHFGHYALSRSSQADAVANAARDQCDGHGGANNGQQAAQNNFLDRARGLQKSNHFCVTPEFEAET